ncbi:endonuclease IV [Eubacterium limosum]|uniref:Endonuclease IV n=1 Tax=Eubacterium limosum TaxID=1736 RepID=A0A6N3HFR2_EUBLI
MESIYVSSTLMWDADLEILFQMADFYEVGGIEFWAQHIMTKQYDPAKIKALSQHYGLAVLIHSVSWDLNFASINTGIREASIREIIGSIELAEKTGAAEVTVHPPRLTIPGDEEECVERARDGVKRLYDVAEEKGISLSLEIMENIPKEIFTTPEKVQCLDCGLKSIKYTLDVAHCDDAYVLEMYLQAKGISKIHISNRQGKKLHTPLARGDYDFSILMQKLLKKNVPLVVEGFERGSDYSIFQENLNYIKGIV